MNNGTKIRTIAFAVACVNQAISSVGAVDLGNPTANMVYKIISLTCTIVAGSFALYYNNDFTAEGEVGTKITRQMKEMKNLAIETVDEPTDSYLAEDEYISEESEVEDGDE